MKIWIWQKLKNWSVDEKLTGKYKWYTSCHWLVFISCRHLNGCSLDSFSRPSLFITDAFNANHQQERRKNRDGQLLSELIWTFIAVHGCIYHHVCLLDLYADLCILDVYADLCFLCQCFLMYFIYLCWLMFFRCLCRLMFFECLCRHVSSRCLCWPMYFRCLCKLVSFKCVCRFVLFICLCRLCILDVYVDMCFLDVYVDMFYIYCCSLLFSWDITSSA